MGTLLDTFRSHYSAAQEEELSLDEYLDLCRKDSRVYATAAERMLAGIGEAELVDTRNDQRLGRLFGNRVIRRYPAFREFYGMEDAIEQIVAFFKHAAQGLEEKKQILYLLGPVGGGKSSIAERLKSVMELNPIYVLKGSPVNESPLGLFPAERYAQILQDDYGIPRRYLTGIMSPWAIKRLAEYDGDLRQFKVVRVMPSVLRQIAITKTEPGDENNQDISSLVGKIDIRKLEHFAQNDPDAYSYSGGLCLANQGLLEFVEMFKAPIKMLHPLLTATQEGNFKGTEGFSAIPFNGLVVAHSNESEWHSFRNNRNNEAFLDRIYIVKVPYCLRVSDEVKIYDKLLANSSLANAPCAPGTLDMMAQFSVLSRLKEPENSSIYSKMRVYDGETLKDVDPKAKTLQEYRDYAGADEGMNGLSTRFAYKILSAVFNHDQTEIAANPVHLMYVLEQRLVARGPARRSAPPLPRASQGIPGAALRGVHRQGDPDRVPRVVRRIRAEHLRPLRHLCRLLDPGRGLPRSGDRRELRPRVAQHRAREDREARGHRQSQGLPQRDRQLRAACPRQQQRPQSRVEQLREAARGHREEDVQQHRGPAAGHFLQRQGLRRRQGEAPELRRPHDAEGLHGEAGAPARRVVPART